MSQTRRKSHRAKKEGGRRKKTQSKKSSGAKSWPQFVKKTYLDMKRSDKNATFKDAMKKASELKKKGHF